METTMVKYNKASSYVAKPYRIRFVKKKLKKTGKKNCENLIAM